MVQNGWTALISASDKGHADVCQVLVEGKANVNQAMEVRLLADCTFFHIIVRKVTI